MILIASTVVFVRVLVLIAATAPASLPGKPARRSAPCSDVMTVLSVGTWFVDRHAKVQMPPQGNPHGIEIRDVLFAALFALVTLEGGRGAKNTSANADFMWWRSSRADRCGCHHSFHDSRSFSPAKQRCSHGLAFDPRRRRWPISCSKQDDGRVGAIVSCSCVCRTFRCIGFCSRDSDSDFVAAFMSVSFLFSSRRISYWFHAHHWRNCGRSNSEGPERL